MTIYLQFTWCFVTLPAAFPHPLSCIFCLLVWLSKQIGCAIVLWIKNNYYFLVDNKTEPSLFLDDDSTLRDPDPSKNKKPQHITYVLTQKTEICVDFVVWSQNLLKMSCWENIQSKASTWIKVEKYPMGSLTTTGTIFLGYKKTYYNILYSHHNIMSHFLCFCLFSCSNTFLMDFINPKDQNYKICILLGTILIHVLAQVLHDGLFFIFDLFFLFH